jgi:putative peptidoglycan lipid II flippase
LNARHRFGIAHRSGVFNVGSIFGGLFLGYGVGPLLYLSPIGRHRDFGGFLQFAVQWPSLRRAGFRYRPMLSFTDPGVRQILRLMGPAVIGTAAVQVMFSSYQFRLVVIDPATGVVANGPLLGFTPSLYAISIGFRRCHRDGDPAAISKHRAWQSR